MAKYSEFHRWFWAGDIDADPAFEFDEDEDFDEALSAHIAALPNADLISLARGEAEDPDGVSVYWLSPLLRELALRFERAQA